MNTQSFMQALYGKASQGFLSIWTMPGKRTAYFPVTDLSSAVKYAENLFDTYDVYYGVGLRGQDLGDTKRGSNEDVSVLPAFWADIDIAGDAHAETALPQTQDEAMAFLDSLPLKPSIIVSSGNGLHVYWVFESPIGIATAAHRDNVSAALKGWQAHINDKAFERGWKLDNTADLSRVLRVPGGMNHKAGGSGKRAEVLVDNGQRYAPPAFTAYVKVEQPSDTTPAPKKQSDGTTAFTGMVGSGTKIIDGCMFMRHCRDHAAKLTEPQWYAMMSNLALCSDGKELCHQFSKRYPGYKSTQTDAKIAHAQKASKPHTCAYIRDTLHFDCGDCKAKCKAPVALAVITKADTVREMLESDIEDWADVFRDDFVDALAYAKAKMPGDYARFKLRCKGKVNVTDIENCIKAHNLKHRKGSGALAPEPLELEQIDLGGAVIPRRWQVSLEHGVRRLISAKDAETETIACPDAVVITRRLVNIDDDKECLELTFFKDGRWKSVIGSRTHVYNKASILGFGDEGLHITTGTASELVSYLSDYEIANKKVIPRVSSIARLGWLKDDQFFPYAVDEQILFEEDKGTAMLYRNLTEQGDYKTWKDMIMRLRQNNVARFLSAASFASPLLCKMGVRTFVIHLWHHSGSGKTAALKASIAVWGNPLRIMGNGFTTMVGTEQLAGTLRNLPFGIDEKQSADERRLSLEQLVYILGQGSGKIRGAKGGGNAEVLTWHNIVMLTGEEPITKNSSMDGVQTRTFEIYGKPVDDLDFAKEVHVIAEQNYGFAGTEFMRAVCTELKERPDYLRKLYVEFSAAFKAMDITGIHADYVAAVAAGDFLAETMIFDADKDAAKHRAIACGADVYGMNKTQLSASAVERAWDFTTGWLVGNEARFSPDASPQYGKISESGGGAFTEFYVIPHYLDKDLEDAGFNIKKTMQGFKEQGLIETQTEGSMTRTKVKAWISGKSLRCYLFRLKSDEFGALSNKCHS